MKQPFYVSLLRYGVIGLMCNIALTFLPTFSAAQSENKTVFALGDSLTAGYGLAQGDGLVPQLNAHLAANGITIINGGVSGDTSAGGLARLEWSLTPEVDALIVSLGGNDLLRGIAPTATQENLRQIFEIAKARGLPVLLIGMKAPTNFGPAYQQAFDALYPELAAQYDAHFIPSFFSMIDPDARDPGEMAAFMQDDGIHPNKAGVARVVQRLGPEVLLLLSKE